MTSHDWVAGRRNSGLTQVEAAKILGVAQPYLSQLENGSRVAGRELATRAATAYGLPSAIPLPAVRHAEPVRADDLQRSLAALGYPKFAHIAAADQHNPAGVIFLALIQRDLDTRLVEALPWVIFRYSVDLDWQWLLDQARLRNAQNRLGYLVYLARELCKSDPHDKRKAGVFSHWVRELEESRLAREDTLCRESMPAAERAWLRKHRPAAAAHWNLLTSLTPGQLPYAA
ncbi:MAG TPA: helix-turn-helix transcriptional regulator [Bryobacteraceae bacterium]|nr:helix-turn-helix transcriptional regulator [Bryobacteraceae bacterium]